MTGSPPDPVERLARGIGGLQRAFEHAENIKWGLPRDHALRSRLERVTRDIDRRQDAMKEMMSFERANTVSGALSQIMLATAEIDLAADHADKPDVTAAAVLGRLAPPRARLRDYLQPDYLDELAALGVLTAARAV